MMQTNTIVDTMVTHQTVTHKTCSICKKDKLLSDFYKEKHGKIGVKPYCKICYENKPYRNAPTRRGFARNLKVDFLNYLGGQCIKCGYNQCPEAIDFHHLDPSTKKFQIGRRRKTLDNEDIKIELQKCAPLCKNCHAEFHFGRFDLEPYLHKLPKFNENTEKQDSIRDDSLLGLQISFVD